MSAGAVFTYQPATGPPAPLNADQIDPTSTASGILGGEVLALRFNVDLSDAGYLNGTANVRFGDVTLCGLSTTGLNTSSVRQFQAVVNTALGGGSTPYALNDLSLLSQLVNDAFSNGVASVFAQQHLFNGACPP
jgi:hypothetical protein